MQTSRVVFAGLTIALAAILVGLAPTARAATSLPVWNSGDYWVYTVTGEGGGAGIPGLGGSGTMRIDVVGVETVTVGSTSISAYRARMNLTIDADFMGQTVRMYMPGDQWYRVSDLALAKMSVSSSVFGAPFSMTMTVDPPAEIRWPLTAGTTWSTTSTVTTTMNVFGQIQTTTDTATVQHEVEADQSVTVAAGTFTTSPVKETTSGLTGYSLSYWSATAGNWVSQKSYNSLGVEQGGLELTSYKYQGPGLLNINILGLSLLIWLVLIAFVIIAVVAVVLLRRRRPPAAMPMPPMGPMPPQQPPMEPGAPPGMPPSPPPGQGP